MSDKSNKRNRLKKARHIARLKRDAERRAEHHERLARCAERRRKTAAANLAGAIDVYNESMKQDNPELYAAALAIKNGSVLNFTKSNETIKSTDLETFDEKTISKPVLNVFDEIYASILEYHETFVVPLMSEAQHVPAEELKYPDVDDVDDADSSLCVVSEAGQISELAFNGLLTNIDLASSQFEVPRHLLAPVVNVIDEPKPVDPLLEALDSLKRHQREMHRLMALHANEFPYSRQSDDSDESK